MLVEYAPSETSALELLSVWSSSHSSDCPAPATHFRSAVRCTTFSQLEAALSWVNSSPALISRHRFSDVASSVFEGPFYRAEEVQQDYIAKDDGAGMS